VPQRLPPLNASIPVAPFVEERILDYPVHPVSKAEAAEAVVARGVHGERGAYVCLTNVHTTVESRRLPQLRAAAEGAFLSVPDGVPLKWILRRRGYPHTEKVTGIEYMPLVAKAGADLGLRHFFYGGAPGVAEAAGRELAKLVPGTQVVGALSPPFATIEDWPVEELSNELHRTKPHLLWVGLGAPKQELWMARMAGLLDVPVMIGVGAGFDFLAGTKRACPPYLRHIGLEWAFRLLAEPRRLWRRYLLGNGTFVWLLSRDAVDRRRARGSWLRSK
jgi:N-acetylglucosaminyldiphosphoundecaprenol N-acetyl-beta-D-mannosaminyltransferase